MQQRTEKKSYALHTLKTAHREGGVALLFSVLLTSVLLLVAFGISNIAYKELLFSIEARDSDLAFFAADTGAECGMYLWNKAPAMSVWRNITDTTLPDITTSMANVTCLGINPLIIRTGGGAGVDHFSLPLGQQCVDVTVDLLAMTSVTITARGYNVPHSGTDPSVCFPPLGATPTNLVSRVIQVTIPI